MISELLWRGYGWMATRANCCVIGCSCMTLPIIVLSALGGGLLAWHLA